MTYVLEISEEEKHIAVDALYAQEKELRETLESPLLTVMEKEEIRNCLAKVAALKNSVIDAQLVLGQI